MVDGTALESECPRSLGKGPAWSVGCVVDGAALDSECPRSPGKGSAWSVGCIVDGKVRDSECRSFAVSAGPRCSKFAVRLVIPAWLVAPLSELNRLALLLGCLGEASNFLFDPVAGSPPCFRSWTRGTRVSWQGWAVAAADAVKATEEDRVQSQPVFSSEK
jgi:hypothetical protein